MQSILALEDGRIFRGHGYGHPGECLGEVVFNTSLTGYQEIATDPSYAGQIGPALYRRPDRPRVLPHCLQLPLRAGHG